MSTEAEARDQLSHDMGDFFERATTAAGTTTTVVSDPLQDFEDDKFGTRQGTVFIEGGQTSGPTTDEERGMLFPGAKVGATITVKWAFSAMADQLTFQVHRLFRADEKSAAILKAIDLVTPIVWKKVTSDITIVADQFDYELSAIGFYQDRPHQVHMVSNDDTEITVPIHDWEIREETKLHLNRSFQAGDTIRVYGIGVSALADLDVHELMIVSARAFMYLIDNAITAVPADQVGRFQSLKAIAIQLFSERVTRHMKMAISKQVMTQAWASGAIDVDFGIP